jgi:hypothetical protein
MAWCAVILIPTKGDIYLKFCWFMRFHFELIRLWIAAFNDSWSYLLEHLKNSIVITIPSSRRAVILIPTKGDVYLKFCRFIRIHLELIRLWIAAFNDSWSYLLEHLKNSIVITIPSSRRAVILIPTKGDVYLKFCRFMRYYFELIRLWIALFNDSWSYLLERLKNSIVITIPSSRRAVILIPMKGDVYLKFCRFIRFHFELIRLWIASFNDSWSYLLEHLKNSIVITIPSSRRAVIPIPTIDTIYL